MLSFIHKNKIVIPIFIISVLYNLIFFSVFIYFLLQYQEKRISLTLAFLLFYTLLALPLKDWFIHSVFFKLLYPDAETTHIKDKRIKELGNKSQINPLLGILIRELDMEGLVLVFSGKHVRQNHFYRTSEKKRQQVNHQDIETISRYFQQTSRKPLTIFASGDLKIIADRYRWGAFVPVYYKSRYFGFIAMVNEFDAKKIAVIEGLATRIGLIMENDTLTESAIKNESFRKEFSLARQVEKFLFTDKTIQIQNYEISVDPHFLETVSFPVLFEKSIIQLNDHLPFVIFCRVSKSNRRMRTMILFMIAGYFLTHSKNSKNLSSLITKLNKSILANGSEFSLDGFLFQAISTNQIKIHWFGKNVQIKYDGFDNPLDKISPLGLTKNPATNFIHLKNKKEILLCLNQVPAIRIKQQ